MYCCVWDSELLKKGIYTFRTIWIGTPAVSNTPWWRHQMETFSALLAICAENSPVPVNSPHKGQWRGALMFSLICVWINDWVNNGEAGDLRRYRIHYDVTVMRTATALSVAIGSSRYVKLSFRICSSLTIKRNMCKSMLHIPVLWYFDTSVIYPQWFRRVKFVIIPPRLHCSIIWEISLYNWQLVVITYELKYVARAAHR